MLVTADEARHWPMRWNRFMAMVAVGSYGRQQARATGSQSLATVLGCHVFEACFLAAPAQPCLDPLRLFTHVTAGRHNGWQIIRAVRHHNYDVVPDSPGQSVRN